MGPLEVRKCSKCGTEKPLTDYYFRKERNNHYFQCKLCWHQKGLSWISKNPEKHRDFHRRWVANDPENAREAARRGSRKRRLDPQTRCRMAFSTALWASLVGIRKRRPTFELLGYTREQLISHLERQFQRGMSWDNYGDWHIDHIRPLSSFKIASKDDPSIQEAWGLSNLRPLWARENILKKDKRTHLV